jgi:hypothetical protein
MVDEVFINLANSVEANFHRAKRACERRRARPEWQIGGFPYRTFYCIDELPNQQCWCIFKKKLPYIFQFIL